MRQLKLFKKLLTDDRGQSTTEYILILAVVVMIAMKFKTSITPILENMLGKIGGKMNGALDGLE